MEHTYTRKIGIGATADIFLYDDTHIIKIFHDNIPESSVLNEYQCSKTVEELGLRVPKIIKKDIINGKHSIIMEYITGVSLMEVLFKPNTDNTQLMKTFTLNQYMIHRTPHINSNKNYPLCQGKYILERNIEWSIDLDDKIKKKVLKLLHSLPEGNSLCHNDYHPGNVIQNEKGLYTIDWCDAFIGNPLADIARTSLMFDSKSLPDGISNIRADLINQTRRYCCSLYEETFANLLGVEKLMIDEWKIVVAAPRLYCEQGENKVFLLKLIYDYFQE